MFEQPRWSPLSAVPMAAGLAWLWCAASFGVVGFFFSVIPGCLLLASGVGMLLWAGDLRIPQFAALGGILGIPLALPATFVAGPAAGTVDVILISHPDVPRGSRTVSVAVSRRIDGDCYQIVTEPTGKRFVRQ